MKKEYLIYLFLIITPFIQGLYFEYSFCFINVFLLFMLIYIIIKNKGLYYGTRRYIYLLGTLPILYGIVSFVAIDKGMNIYGFMKVLEPVLLYIVLIQYNIKEEKLKKAIASSGVIISLISIVSIYFKDFSSLLVQDNRLAGFFGYANTNGIFLLIAFILLQNLNLNKYKKVIFSLIIALNIVFTYSRSVYVICLLIILYIIIKNIFYYRKEGLRKCFSNFKYIILFILLYFIIIKTSSISINYRVEQIDVNQTELTARLLYYFDALKIIWNNLLGLGYDGYYFVQGIYQSGIYKVRLVHSSILQIGLEIGIAGMLVYIGIIARYIRKPVKGIFNLVFWILVIHSLLDFDLSFLAVSNILIIILYLSEVDNENETLNNICQSKNNMGNNIIFSCIIGVLLVIANVIIGMSSWLYYLGNKDNALVWYKYNTEVIGKKVIDLYNEGNISECLIYIDLENRLNSFNIDTFKIYRNIAIDKMDLISAIKIQKNILKLDRINISEVEKYSDLLLEIIRNKDYNEEVRKSYKKELLSIRTYIDVEKTKISKLAYKQKRMPIFVMTKKLLDNEKEAINIEL